MFKPRTTPEEVTPADAAALQRTGALLLDVREDEEWCSGHAPDAIHLPLSEVTGAAARFEGRHVLTVCRSGGRSAQAAEALAAAGVDVRNVAGGMSSWAEAGLAVVRDDGMPGTVA